jgi:hypothetical protein
MSEFSESYHLRGSSRRDAIDLLQRSGLVGFVFPALDGWVSFVAEGEPFKPNPALLDANEDVLLRWVFAEDHGWAFDIFKAKQKLVTYECSWEEEVEVTAKVSHKELQLALSLELPGLAGDMGARLLFPSSIDEVVELKPAYAFAAAIGLTNYRWLAYEYMTRDTESGHPLPAGVQRVGDA